jgi:hypothetical protein
LQFAQQTPGPTKKSEPILLVAFFSLLINLIIRFLFA